MIVTIDGPAAAGKSTVARLVAERLGFLYLDTGAMYRAFTLKAVRSHADLDNEEALAELARETKIEFRKDSRENLRVFLDGEDVTGKIRGREVTSAISRIAPLAKVREQMVIRQRAFAGAGGIVVEGRDISTVVFPEAEKKFYLDAEIKERTRRRFLELKQKNESVELRQVENELAKRDEKDKSRAVGPLRKAPDAVYIDTTGLSIDEVVEEIIRRIL